MSNAFFSDLADLMDRHGVKFIFWDCGPGSDTHGIYDSKIAFEFSDENVIYADSDSLSASDIGDIK